jgi:molybdopterin synthase catalytic subunit
MSVTISISDGPLPSLASAWTVDGAGALLCFDGAVRPSEAGRPIIALDYEAYEPMATRMLTRIAQELLDRHHLLAIRVDHSRGRVGIGEVSYRLRIASKHRKEAIAALDEFTDRLKKDVPIWKTAVYP